MLCGTQGSVRHFSFLEVLMKKKGTLFLMVLFAAFVCITVLPTFGKAEGIVLTDWKAEGNRLHVSVTCTDSSVQLGRMKAEEKGQELFLSFYPTFGSGQMNGKHSFEAALSEDCERVLLYESKEGFRPVLRKDGKTGEWTELKKLPLTED